MLWIEVSRYFSVLGSSVGHLFGFLSCRWPRFVAAFLGLVWFLHLGGVRTLDPLNSSWLSGDWLQHWSGFLFFKQEPWTFPLGTLASVPYPIGTNIGFTDSIPLVAILIKPFARILPFEFQYIGIWLCLSFVLQGYVGALLCSTVTGSRVHQALGGSLFALSPVLTSRVGHEALSAHWLILGLLYFGLRSYEGISKARQIATLTVAWVLLSASIHPYLAAICSVLALANVSRLALNRHLSIRDSGIFAVAMLAGTVAIFWVIGYFGEPGTATGGFGVYSSDLLAFFDPRSTSRFIPSIPTQPAQWEGFAFPGLGGWFAIGCAMYALTKRPKVDWRSRSVVVWAAAILAVYALSSHITIAGSIVAHARTFYAMFEPIPSWFRASGRFVWPLHYLLLLFGVWGIAQLGSSFHRLVAIVLLSLAVGIQAVDFTMDPWWFSDKHTRQQNPADFELARGRYDHLALFPPQVGAPCQFATADGGSASATIDEAHIYRYSLLAYRIRLTYNSGTFARMLWTNIERHCQAALDEVASGQLDARTVYVVAPEHVKVFRAASAICNRFDGDWVCVRSENADPFREYVASGKLTSTK